MGAIIGQTKKEKLLEFIKSNFGSLSQREMARHLGIGKTAINRWCRELGLEFERHSVNEDYFSGWGSEMAYVLGFIFADGNISWHEKKSYRALTITASEKDKMHLEMLRNMLSSTKPLLYSNSTKSYRLIVNNKKVCEDLMKYNLTPRKSLTVKFPNIPTEFLPHFLRGVIDGDGNVRYVNRKRSPYFEITVSSGSKKFLDKMAKIISENGISGKPRKTNKNLFILQYSCQRGLDLANWIYKDADLFLERKHQPYLEALRVGGGDML